MKVLATYNIKGGVGKTSAAVNLAHLASRGGARILLWDLDPQGAASFLFRVKPRIKGGGKRLVRGKSELESFIKGTDHEGLDLLPADFSYRHMDLVLDDGKRRTRRLSRLLAPLANDYDIVFLDCPPSISLVSENVFEAADALLVPLIPTTLSLRTFSQLLDFVEGKVESAPQIIAFFSMVDRRKKLHREVLEALPASHRSVVRSAIPALADVENMGVHRSVVGDFAPRSRAARAYEALWSEVQERLGD